MKKFLLTLAAVAMTASVSWADDPVFPESFTIETSSSSVKVGTIEEMIPEYAPMFEDRDELYSFAVKGTTNADEVTITMAIPDGWDGFLFSPPGEMDNPGLMRKANAVEMIPISAYDEDGNYSKGNSFSIPADGKIYFVQGFLYKGEEMDVNNQIACMGQITKDGSSVTPTTPEKFELGVIPANGAVVKSLSKVTLAIPLAKFDLEAGHQPGMDEEKFMEIVIKKGDEVVANVAGMGEPGFNETDMTQTVPVLFEPAVTEAGEYTIFVPEGTFTENTWNEEQEEYLPLEGGMLSAELTSTFTVDPTAPSPMDVYTFNPESGSTVSQIASVNLSFSQIPAETYFDNRGFQDATFSNGEITIDAAINYVLNAANCREMVITPYDSETYDEAPITTLGTWTLTIKKGTFLLDDEESPEIVAEFIVSDVTEPIFPEEFVITTDPADLEVEQIPAEEFMGVMPYTIVVNGKCTEKTATITIEVPEGWTNFIWQNQDISFGSKKKAKAEWESKADLIAEGYTEGNVIELPVDSRSHIYYLYLCNGDQVDTANDIQLDVMLNRHFPDLTFPEKFDITLSSEGPKVEQASEEWEFEINITGECMGETLTATFAVPEGWDGIIGATDADVEDPDINPLSTRAEEDLIFMPLEVVENGDVPLKKTNEFTFAADGEEHYGMAFLYKDDMACYKQINMTVKVLNKQSGISNIDAADSEVRYFNLQGVEVANPENGVYVKVANGKASKVNVK